jgi:L-aspartate oxidase
MPNEIHSDVLIIGAGAAGLSLALRLPKAWRVTVIAKSTLSEGNTYYAQGGISAVLSASDSFATHIADTLDSGAGLCHEAIVRKVVQAAPACIAELDAMGMAFTRASGEDYHLTREGGHSQRRVAHAADATGRALETTLLAQASARPNLHLRPGHIALDLITHAKLHRTGANRCVGAYALDYQTGEVHTLGARYTVLATGGASQAYLHTTNPELATGDGIAIAWRAGCAVSNLEFTQFHPTSLYQAGGKPFLISEAVRGEGAHLQLPGGARFMAQYDPRAELAPRDIVARAIDHEMKRRGLPHVWLDIHHKPADFIRQHFPNIYQHCLEAGYDLTQTAVPVVPAAHYTCGGVMTDDVGRTTLEGLYAIGETASTGLHGANRLASNSLLECLAFGQFAAAHMLQASSTQSYQPLNLPLWDATRVTASEEEVVISHDREELRRLMWDYVGIVRSNKRLHRARQRLTLLQAEIREHYSHYQVTRGLLELRNLVQVADLVIRSALLRQESRGLHYTTDYPENAQPPKDTVLQA